MATKKKAKKKQTKSKQAARGKLAAKKKTGKKKAVGKEVPPKEQSESKSAHKKAKVKAVSKKTNSSRRGPVRRRSQTAEANSFSAQEAASSAGQAGDLQGLSDVEAADSESADELIEEGNAFEAGIVTGVEDAERATPSEVHTHEVLEDDVPEEYVDPD
jgi:hypothetical protein